MEYSTLESGREISSTGVVYEIESVHERLGQLTDLRKARGKQYSLVTILTLILLAKLSGQDKPVKIADWAKNNQAKLVELLKLEKAKMPHHNTYRRVLAQSIYVVEIERLVGEYNPCGKHGRVICNLTGGRPGWGFIYLHNVIGWFCPRIKMHPFEKAISLYDLFERII